MKNDELREALAAYAHEAWSGWMRWMLPKLTTRVSGVNVPHVVQDVSSSHEFDPVWHHDADWWLKRWRELMDTSYQMLTEEDKESDRIEADKMIAIMEQTTIEER